MSNICNFCGKDEVLTSRTRTAVYHYCQSCGESTKEDRDIPLEDWIDKKQLSNKKKIANLKNVR